MAALRGLWRSGGSFFKSCGSYSCPGRGKLSLWSHDDDDDVMMQPGEAAPYGLQRL